MNPFALCSKSPDEFSYQNNMDLHLTLLNNHSIAGQRMGNSNPEMYGKFMFNQELFDIETVQRLAEHYVVLLESATLYPTEPVWRLPLTSEMEREMILSEYSCSQVPASSDGLPPDAIQVFQTFLESLGTSRPHNIAVREFDSQRNLTYAELNTQSNVVSNALTASGVLGGMCVGLLIEISCLESIVGVLGIVKTGAVCIPLDPRDTHDQLVSIISDARISHIVVKEEQDCLVQFASTKLLSVQKVLNEHGHISTAQPVLATNRDAPHERSCYAIYKTQSDKHAQVCLCAY